VELQGRRNWIEGIWLAAGLLCGLAYAQWELPLLLDLALLGIGIGLLVSGAFTIYQHRVSAWMRAMWNIYSQGPAVILWGWVLGLAGLGLTLLFGLRRAGLDQALMAYVQRKPGAVMLAAGMAGVSLSGAWLLGTFEAQMTWIRHLSLFPARLIHALIVLAGTALILLGLWEMAAPQVFRFALARWWAASGLPLP
jgi:hypothetical protein